MSFIDYNLIKETSRNLRKNDTRVEKRFWCFIRSRKLCGKKFLRQYSIKIEIDNNNRFLNADFYCAESKLVVEIDGGIHQNQKEYDSYRSYIINCLGIKVVRYTNEEVLNNIEAVLDNLKSLL